MWGVLCYELLKPGETVTGERYALQLNRSAEQIEEKRPYTGRDGRRPVIVQHDNAICRIEVPWPAKL